jgi:hypothetical protein
MEGQGLALEKVDQGVELEVLCRLSVDLVHHVADLDGQWLENSRDLDRARLAGDDRALLQRNAEWPKVETMCVGHWLWPTGTLQPINYGTEERRPL